jgi:hypothetical protein|tara:strand:+ start:278 stop:523 length:246 start_codon:yes stop_codon:yes gene_type:complete
MLLNPFKLWKIYRAASTVVATLNQEGNMSKKLWTSKTFWFQVLSAAAALSGVVPLPPEILAVVVGVINIGLRLVTDKPVEV